MVVWCIVPKSPFTGTKNIYLLAKDNSGESTGFMYKGTLTIPNQPPDSNAFTLSPSSGKGAAGVQQIFKATYSDPDGWQNLRHMQLLVNDKVLLSNCGNFLYDNTVNKLYLKNNDGTGWDGGHAPESTNIIENKYAKLNCAQTKVTRSGNNITIDWAITFTRDFTGTKKLYMSADDYALTNTGTNTGAKTAYVQKGTWTIE
jgi:hypothetical protein